MPGVIMLSVVLPVPSLYVTVFPAWNKFAFRGNNTQYDGTQYKDTQYKDTQFKDTQCKDTAEWLLA